MKEIPLTQDKIALVDDDDYERVAQFRWHAHHHKPTGNWYAKRTIDTSNRQISMHRFIMDASQGSKIDHIDHDGLNNQRSNLRFATTSQNGMNRRVNRDARFKGVHWYADHQKWKTTITLEGKLIYIGEYDSEEEAAEAYDVAALQYFGEYAFTNFEHNRGR